MEKFREIEPVSPYGHHGGACVPQNMRLSLANDGPVLETANEGFAGASSHAIARRYARGQPKERGAYVDQEAFFRAYFDGGSEGMMNMWSKSRNSKGRARSDGKERVSVEKSMGSTIHGISALPGTILEPTSDLYMRRLWGNPKEVLSSAIQPIFKGHALHMHAL